MVGREGFEPYPHPKFQNSNEIGGAHNTAPQANFHAQTQDRKDFGSKISIDAGKTRTAADAPRPSTGPQPNVQGAYRNIKSSTVADIRRGVDECRELSKPIKAAIRALLDSVEHEVEGQEGGAHE